MTKKILEHKGYKGRVRYDQVKNVIRGEVLDTKHKVTFETYDTFFVNREFEKAVERYIEECRQNGDSNDVVIAVSIPKDVLERAKEFEVDSMNDFVTTAMKNYTIACEQSVGEPTHMMVEFTPEGYRELNHAAVRAGLCMNSFVVGAVEQFKTFQWPNDLDRKVKVAAQKQGLKPNEFVQNIIAQHFEDNQ